MPLTLRIVGSSAHPPDAEPTYVFDSEGRIGRKEGNDWVLPDSKRLISRNHAAIQFESGEWYLKDTSNNGTEVNGQVYVDQRVRLSHGDRLRISAQGPYEVAVEISDSLVDAAPAPVLQERATGDTDVDPVKAWVTPPQDSAFQDSTDGSETDDGLSQSPDEPPWDADPSIYRPKGAAVPEDLFAPELGPNRQPSRQPEPQTTERPQPDAVPPLPPVPPTPTPTPTVDTSMSATMVVPDAQGGAVFPWQAFLKGAGLEASQPEGDLAVVMSRAGKVFREMVKGIRNVLIARVELRNAYRIIGNTQLRVRDNNPFKFGDLNDALEALLFRSGSDYKDPIESAQAAVADIEAHQIAIMAGMDAAIKAMIDEFDPEDLEQRFAKQARIVGKLRFWDLYRERFEDLSSNNAEKLHDTFRDRFATAYEAKMSEMLTRKGNS